MEPSLVVNTGKQTYPKLLNCLTPYVHQFNISVGISNPIIYKASDCSFLNRLQGPLLANALQELASSIYPSDFLCSHRSKSERRVAWTQALYLANLIPEYRLGCVQTGSIEFSM